MNPSTGKCNMKCAEIFTRDREDGVRMVCIREFRYVNTKIYFKENGAIDESKDMSFFDEEKRNEVLEKVAYAKYHGGEDWFDHKIDSLRTLGAFKKLRKYSDEKKLRKEKSERYRNQKNEAEAARASLSGRRCYPDTGGCYTDSEDSQDMDQEDMDMEDSYSGAICAVRVNSHSQEPRAHEA